MRTISRISRALAALCIVGGVATAASLPAAGQEAPAEDELVELPDSYLDGYGWWNKTEQNPAGGENPGAPVPVGTNCQPTDVNQCPAGPPADGIYVVYDYEATAPTVVTGPIANAPIPGAPQPPPPAPNVAQPQPLGPIAYGAVRYIVPEGAETELTLSILSRSSTQPGGTDPTIGKLFACVVATPGWAAIQNGRYDQAPKYDCTTGDEAELTADAATFSLGTAFVQGTTLDVVIVGAGDRPFQMAFGPPSESSLRVVSAPETALLEEPLVEDYTFEDPLTSFDASITDVPADVGFVSDGAFAPIGDFAAAPSVPVARPQTRQAVTAGRVVNPFSPDASRGERMMAVALLLVLGGGLWWVGGQPARAPRLLGSLGNGQVVDAGPATGGGIGRFAKPRHGKPPRLF